MASLREQIEEMLKKEPKDTFLRYSLAMEFEKEGRNDESLKLFDELINDDPPHVPAFFMAAQQLVKLEREEEAIPILEQGIQQAQSQGDEHAAMEMTGYLDMIQ